MRFIIITGLSGAGKSQAIKYMEDIGFYCIDNMPPSLVPKFAEICYQSQVKIEKVALVIDTRGGKLFDEFFKELDNLKNMGYKYEILFLEASDEILIKRYKETRRRHPLATDGRVIDGIEKEKKLLKTIKDKSSYIIDTSQLLPRQLKEQITHIFEQGDKYESIIINIVSFGFKYGIPLDSDLVFDVRFIPNPYYVTSLKKYTGKNKHVKNYVLKWKETKEFLLKLEEMIEFLIPNYMKEGKSQLVISIGCTGGRHRSVTIAEELFKSLKKTGHNVFIKHKDIDNDAKSKM